MDQCSGLPDSFQALPQQIDIPMPELDVVSGCGSVSSPTAWQTRGPNLGLGLADLFGG
jgi:hypothetical protein